MDTRRVDMTVGISYDADIGQARKIILDLARANELVLTDTEPMVELVEMADSSVNLVVRTWCNTADYWAVFFSLNRSIKEAMDEAGIGIPYPQMDIHHHGMPTAGVA
jgi:small conductance mechanosensitive channel